MTVSGNPNTGHWSPGPVVTHPASSELELVVRREHSLLTPNYHVTVASTAPIAVKEVFDFQTRAGLAAAAETAMDKLRSRGYRLTGPMEVHESFVTAHVVLDEREAATVELVADMGADVRAIARALPLMGTREGAQQMVKLIADLTAGAQALWARADAVLSSDSQVEAAAVYDDVVTVVDGGAL
jgi:hypothetical protein